MSGQPNVEQWWNSLLRYIEDGEVVPIVGRDLLWLNVEGQAAYLPLLLAQQLADRLGLPLPSDADDDPIDRVVRDYFSQSDHDHQLPYAELNSLARGLSDAAPPAALRKLAELPFSRFVSTTWDSFLERAVDATKLDGESTAVVVNSLGSPMDIPERRAGVRVVVHLLGRSNPSPDYAVTEADTVEFVHEFLSNNQPERLLKVLKTQHVLVIGGLSVWITRFLLRLVRGGHLWATRGQRHFFADPDITRDRDARRFLEHPLSTSSVFLTDDARMFVDELHDRWVKRGRRRPQPTSMTPVVSHATAGDAAGVFLSYAKEDVAAAVRVEKLLSGAGVAVWLDRKDLLPGDQWDSVIRRRVAGCAVFVALLSKHTMSAGYVQREWKWGASRREEIPEGDKFAFPILIDGADIDPLKLPELYRGAQLAMALDGAVTDGFVREVRDACDVFQAKARL